MGCLEMQSNCTKQPERKRLRGVDYVFFLLLFWEGTVCSLRLNFAHKEGSNKN